MMRVLSLVVELLYCRACLIWASRRLCIGYDIGTCGSTSTGRTLWKGPRDCLVTVQPGYVSTGFVHFPRPNAHSTSLGDIVGLLQRPGPPDLAFVSSAYFFSLRLARLAKLKDQPKGRCGFVSFLKRGHMGVGPPPLFLHFAPPDVLTSFASLLKVITLLHNLAIFDEDKHFSFCRATLSPLQYASYRSATNLTL